MVKPDPGYIPPSASGLPSAIHNYASFFRQKQDAVYTKLDPFSPASSADAWSGFTARTHMLSLCEYSIDEDWELCGQLLSFKDISDIQAKQQPLQAMIEGELRGRNRDIKERQGGKSFHVSDRGPGLWEAMRNQNLLHLWCAPHQINVVLKEALEHEHAREMKALLETCKKIGTILRTSPKQSLFLAYFRDLCAMSDLIDETAKLMVEDLALTTFEKRLLQAAAKTRLEEGFKARTGRHGAANLLPADVEVEGDTPYDRLLGEFDKAVATLQWSEAKKKGAISVFHEHVGESRQKGNNWLHIFSYQKDSEIRWTGKSRLLQTMVKNFPWLEYASKNKDMVDDEWMVPDPPEFELLADACAVLRFLEYPQGELQAHKQVTLSRVLPLIRVMTDLWEEQKQKLECSETVKAFIQVMLTAFKAKIFLKQSERNSAFTKACRWVSDEVEGSVGEDDLDVTFAARALATFLDPRYKQCAFIADDPERGVTINGIKKFAKTLYSKMPPRKQNFYYRPNAVVGAAVRAADAAAGGGRPARGGDLQINLEERFAAREHEMMPQQRAAEETFDQELERWTRFRGENVKPLTFWKSSGVREYPRVAVLARQYLATPASAALDERSNSQIANIERARAEVGNQLLADQAQIKAAISHLKTTNEVEELVEELVEKMPPRRRV